MREFGKINLFPKFAFIAMLHFVYCVSRVFQAFGAANFGGKFNFWVKIVSSKSNNCFLCVKILRKISPHFS